MKRSTACMLLVIFLCAGFMQEAYGEIDSRFNKDNWQKYAATHGYNCKLFASLVMKNLFGVDLPSIYKYDQVGEDDRLLSSGTIIGQHLNEVSGSPTASEMQATFSKAQAGDVVQMVWNAPGHLHTFVIAGVESDGIWVLQSNIPAGTIVNSNYTWQKLAEVYTNGGNKGGFTLYRFVESVPPGGSVRIDETNFPDEWFRKNVLRRCDSNRDEILSSEELASVTHIDCSDERIKDLKGIENFTALTHLYCSSNRLTTLDVSKNTALTHLYCSSNRLTTLDVSKNTALTHLECRNNQLTTFDVSKNTALTYLECYNNRLTTLDVSKNTALIYLACNRNQLTTLDLSNCSSLGYLYCKENQLTTLDVSSCPSLFDTLLRDYHVYCDEDVIVIYSNKNKPSITTSALKTGTVGKSYKVTLKAKGSTPLTWSAQGLPKGLALSEKGKISGKPAETGTFTVKFTVSNGSGSSTKELRLTINALPPKISGPLAKAQLGESYSSGLKLKQGTEPITWSITGALPEGLSFNTSTGIISGIPKSYSSSGFKLKITASNSAGSKTKSVRLKVNGKKPKITTKTLPEAVRWEKYRAELTATGSQPITWKADNLPLGLTLDPESGIISGTPAVSGSSLKFTVYASNPVKTVKKSLTLRVKLSSNSELPEDSAPDDNEAYSLIEHSIPQDELTLTNHNGANPDDCIIVAVLPEISADVSGIYDFGITVSDDVPEDSELIYLANSDQPSSDDEIAEFFDETGGEISLVPKSRKFTVSVWLNKGVIYSPRIAVRK